MELLTHKDKHSEYTYYLDNGDRAIHGEHIYWHTNGKIWILSYWWHGKCHGEYKIWKENGETVYHCFYINGDPHPCVEMTEQEKLLFQIKYPGFKFLPTS